MDSSRSDLLNFTTCKNCSHQYDGKYCNKCGQSASTKDINHRYVWGEISDAVFKVNNNFLLTVKDLFIRPSKMIKDYINGKRIRYFKPINYVLILITIYTFIEHSINKKTFLEEVFIEIKKILFKNHDKYSLGNEAIEWLIENAGISFLILIPIYSLSSYLAFISSKKQYNYFKHLLLNTYLNGQALLIYIIIEIVSTLINYNSINTTNYIEDYIVFIYITCAYFFFFNNFNPFIRLIRIAIFYILLTLLVIIIGLLISFFNQ